MESISVVIPAYNEYQTLPHVTRDLANFLKKCNIYYEILIINDGSTDRTGELAENLSRSYDVLKVIHHEKRKGMSYALRTGFNNAHMEYVTFLPADGQISSSEIQKLIHSSGGYDLVISYYNSRPDSFLRLFISRVLRVIIFIILGMRVRLEGIYLFRRSILAEIKLRCSASAGLIGLELVYKAIKNKYKISSVAIDCLPRLSGKSKVSNLKTILITFYELLKIRFSYKSS